MEHQMDNVTFNLRQALIVFCVAAPLAYGAGYQFAPREILDSTVEHVGFLTTDTKRVLSATVESLKSESRLISYSYVGTQNVQIDRSAWYIFSGQQQLIVPATVSYFIELANLTESSATFDESSNTVKVTLPRLMLNVDFDPRRATTFNSGSLTLSDSVVQELTKLNYDTARKAAIKQGQQAEMVRLARDRTRENIERIFRISLGASGKNGLKIEVTFEDQPKT
jgi:Protein of unknown function (DUF4230)